MKEILNKISLLLLSVVLQILFIVPKLIILFINIIQGLLRIIKNTLTFLIEQITNEVLKKNMRDVRREKTKET